MKRAALPTALRNRVSRRKARRFRRPSRTLLIGAVAGLLGLAVTANACIDDGPTLLPVGESDGLPDAGPPDATGPAAEAAYNITISTTPVAFEDFIVACKERGGFVQTTAACAGNNACKGFSYIEPDLTEHSCKGMNNCGPGMSCVVLPKDSGLTGKEVYEQEEACAATCHAQFEPVYDPSVYTLYVRPDTLTLDDALDRFLTGSNERLYATVAFGVHGISDNGVAYANMPPWHKKFSRAEIERVVAYIRTLAIQPTIYEITGPKSGH
jgi:hypothetical protein